MAGAEEKEEEKKEETEGAILVRSFRDGPLGPDPESRNTDCACIWIPGSLAVARAPE